MKKKGFHAYLEKRLNKEEITAIEKAAEMEKESFQLLQQDIAKAVNDYMIKHNVGFNDFLRQLGKSPTQLSRILKGEANLTLSTVAQIYAAMGCRAHIVSKDPSLAEK